MRKLFILLSAVALTAAAQESPMPGAYSLTAAASGWGTICLPYAAEIPDGIELFVVAGAIYEEGKTEVAGVAFAELQTTITEAGVPYFYHAAAPGTTYTFWYEGEPAEAQTVNSLVGALVQTTFCGYDSGEVCILQGGKLKIATWTDCAQNGVSANRAFIDMKELRSLGESYSPARVMMIEQAANTPTDIVTERSQSKPTRAESGCYDLLGHHIDHPTCSGLYISNGKKICIP